MLEYNAFAFATGGVGSMTVGLSLMPAALNAKDWWELIISVALIIWGVVSLLAVGPLGRAALRHGAKIIDSHLEFKDEVFALYLRAFAEDSDMGRPQQMSGTGSIVRHIWGGGFITEEAQLVYVLRSVGEMVTVGRPGEILPHFGAKRLYLSSDEWQEQVRDLMRRARLVVVMLSLSAGVAWELAEAFRTVPPERFLLVVPMANEEYEEFRKNLAASELLTSARRADGALVSLTLPGFSRSPELSSTLRGLIYFSPAWEATLIPLAKYSAFYNTLRGSVARAIRPFLLQLREYENGVSGAGAV